MFNQFLEKIKSDHPLFGLEQEDQNQGHLAGLKAPDWVEEGPVYEIFVRNFSSQGNLEDRKGVLGSPYAIQDYSAIDPALGTAADLKNLVETVHRGGMRLILDLVANHMAVDSVWRDEFPEHFLQDDQGNITRKISEWSDVVDLDYSNQPLRIKMREMICSWVRDFDIDGYRCDVARLVPLDFWEDVHNDLTKIKKDIFLLAEWESANLHPTAFHASYDWSTHFILQDIYEGKRPAADAITWVVEKEANYPKNALPLRFTENHDFERTLGKFGPDSFYPFVVFNFIQYGLPLIYCGQEFGLKNTPTLSEKDPIVWDQFNENIFKFYKTLITLRKNYPALSSRELIRSRNDKQDQIVTIEKSYRDSTILAVLNFSQKQLKAKIELSDSYHNIQQFEELFSGKKISKTEFGKFTIKPYGFFLFKADRL
jgi:glycosidase